MFDNIKKTFIRIRFFFKNKNEMLILITLENFCSETYFLFANIKYAIDFLQILKHNAFFFYKFHNVLLYRFINLKILWCFL